MIPIWLANLKSWSMSRSRSKHGARSRSWLWTSEWALAGSRMRYGSKSRMKSR